MSLGALAQAAAVSLGALAQAVVVSLGLAQGRVARAGDAVHASAPVHAATQPRGWHSAQPGFTLGLL